MKITNRIHRKGATKPVKSQDETPNAKAVTVIFNSAEDGRELLRRDFSQTLYSACLRSCKILNWSIADYYAVLFQSKIARGKIVKRPSAPRVTVQILPFPAQGGAQ
jgi:hypothetical protein